jgi:hypothetical protein
MRLRPKALIFTRACDDVGLGTGVEESTNRDSIGPLPFLMSIAFMVEGGEAILVVLLGRVEEVEYWLLRSVSRFVMRWFMQDEAFKYLNVAPESKPFLNEGAPESILKLR